MRFVMRPLADCCEIIMGQAPAGSSYNEIGEGHALIAGASDFGETSPEPKKYTTEASKLSKKGDIIICIRATIGDINWSDQEYCLGRGVAVLRPKNGQLDSNYLWHFIGVHKNQLASKGTGSTFKQVSRSHIAEWEIPLPPLAEQKRIAVILDKAAAIRQKRQQAVSLADNFLRSVFFDMFGDPVTNPKRWPTKPLKALSRVVTGNTPSRKEPENYGSAIEWIKSDNINTPHHYLTEAEERLSKAGLEKGRIVPSGSVLITCIAGSPHCIGNAAIADRKVSFNQQINALVPQGEATTEYLYSIALFGKRLIQEVSTNAMKGMVSKGSLEKLQVPAPPKELQARYSHLFNELLNVRQRKIFSLEQSRSLFDSLSQKAFSGEL